MATRFKSTYRLRSAPSVGCDRVAGFTLVELMIVLVIVAALLALAVPSFSVVSLRTKLKSYANEVVASAYLARGEAIKRNAPMTLCASSDGSTCAGGGDWDQGWVVMDPNDIVIKHYQAPSSGIKIFGLSSVHTVTFQPSGITNTPTTMTICQQTPSEGIEERQVRISTTARPRVTVPDPSIGCSP
jgi:type IV fimbrial biogenesis protein FimT